MQELYHYTAPGKNDKNRYNTLDRMYYGSSMEDKSCEGSSSLRYVNRFKSSASSRPSKRL